VTNPNEDDVITLKGRLTADPVLRTTQTGASIVSFEIRVEPPDGEPTLHNIVAWDRLAEVVAQYKRAGHAVEVEGRPEEITVKPEEGPARTIIEINAFRVEFLP
jgi:single-strand DNA-binding protein